MKNKIAILGIIDCILYAVVVALYLTVKSELLLTLWEAVTVISAPVILLLLLSILTENTKANSIFYSLVVVFMSCTIVLTSVAHFINIAVTRKLIAQGVTIPTYLQIGHWPSVEMAIDYLAWGFFMGLAFIMTACALYARNRMAKKLKILLLICGGLCLIGFFGSVIINENCWYIAPLGYGIGTILVCIEMLLNSKQSN